MALSDTRLFPLAYGIRACVASPSPAYTFAVFWIVPLVLHCLLGSISSIRGWQSLRAQDTLGTMRAHERAGLVLTSGYGQIYPLLIVLVEAAQLAYFLISSGTQRGVSVRNRTSALKK